MTHSDAQCPDRTAWISFLDGATPDPRRPVLIQHREECESCRKLLHELLRSEPLSSTTTSGSPSFPSLEEARRIQNGDSENEFPEILGYTIAGQIDDGGMGVVYKAIDHQTADRFVAIKLIRPDLYSAEMVARFREEISSLARISHLNIVTIHGSGELADGRLYFVMDYVDGQSVCDFCDHHEANLTIKDRLRIMVDVCEGVARAHEVPVVHRDLKPGNILVTQQDGDSGSTFVPKVIDFGLSRPLNDRQDASHDWTQPGAPLGTLEYMSPEQARSSKDVDTRTDVYSLGVILYRLLTGGNALPLSGLPLEDALRTIRETEPLHPSAAVTNADAEKIAPLLRSLNMTQQQLGKELRGDLDKLILKALRKDRDDRFTLSELIADLNRFINDYPVEAEPPSQIHRARLAYRRNPWAWWLAAVAFALLLGWLKTTHSAVTLAREKAAIAEDNAMRQRAAKEREVSLRQQEQAARKEAELAKTDADAKTEFLSDAVGVISNSLDTVNPKISNVDRDTAVPNLLQVMGSGLTDAELGDTDAVLRLRMKAAEILVDMGELDLAVPLLESIIETCKRKFGDDDENTDLARIHLGRVYLRHNQLQPAQDVFWEIFQRTRKTLGQDHYRTLAAAHFVAGSQRAGGHYSEAIFMLEQVIKRYQPDGTPRDLMRTDARHQLGQIHFIQKDYEKATEAFHLAIEEFRSIANLPAGHPLILAARSDLAAVLEKKGRKDEAIEHRRELLATTLRQYPRNSEPVSRAKFNLAVLLSNADQHEEALQLLQEASESKSDTDMSLRSQFVMAQILEKQGKAAMAKSVLEELVPEMSRQLDKQNSLHLSAKKLLHRLTAETADGE